MCLSYHDPMYNNMWYIVVHTTIRTAVSLARVMFGYLDICECCVGQEFDMAGYYCDTDCCFKCFIDNICSREAALKKFILTFVSFYNVSKKAMNKLQSVTLFQLNLCVYYTNFLKGGLNIKTLGEPDSCLVISCFNWCFIY